MVDLVPMAAQVILVPLDHPESLDCQASLASWVLLDVLDCLAHMVLPAHQDQLDSLVGLELLVWQDCQGGMESLVSMAIREPRAALALLGSLGSQAQEVSAIKSLQGEIASWDKL